MNLPNQIQIYCSMKMRNLFINSFIVVNIFLHVVTRRQSKEHECIEQHLIYLSTQRKLNIVCRALIVNRPSHMRIFALYPHLVHFLLSLFRSFWGDLIKWKLFQPTKCAQGAMLITNGVLYEHVHRTRLGIRCFSSSRLDVIVFPLAYADLLFQMDGADHIRCTDKYS